MAFPQKRALKEGRTIAFADQSGFYLLPMVVRTYAPVGRTPILHERLGRDHLSAMSAVTLDGRLYMIEQEKAFKGEDAVRFLEHLMRQIPGKLLINMGRLSDTSGSSGEGLSGERGVQAA